MKLPHALVWVVSANVWWVLLLSYIYGALVRRRRRWYADHPSARRRLTCPVISVGNLTVGGSGKTPVVAYLARLLLELGERPAILSRGYGRKMTSDDVVVVGDGKRIHADLLKSGDEPLMLARALPGIAVLVARERYLAGRFAEDQLACTVHLLDDGFQHLMLERDLDLLLISQNDLENSSLLPRGSLREPLEAASAADAVIVTGTSELILDDVVRRFDVERGFLARWHQGDARVVGQVDQVISAKSDMSVMAFAGIARPERFFDGLRAAGWSLQQTITFRDHYQYTESDINKLRQQVRDSSIDLVLTTEKDLVRLLDFTPLSLPLAWVPLTVSLNPENDFRTWLVQRLCSVRESGDRST